MIAGMLRVAGVANGAGAVDDEGAGHLERVALDLFDAVAFAGSFPSPAPGCRAHHFQDVASPETVGLVAITLRVSQAGERSPHAVAKGLSAGRVALSDGDDLSACRFDLAGALTERFQVLPAERSAEVAKEGKDEGLLAPQLREGDVARAIAAAKGGVRGLGAGFESQFDL